MQTLADTCSPDAHVVRITTARRTMILNELNEYRDRIARGDLLGFSPATRMATLQWDPELASFAELNVKRCALVNDHCRNSEQFRNVAQVVAEGGWQARRSPGSNRKPGQPPSGGKWSRGIPFRGRGDQGDAGADVRRVQGVQHAGHPRLQPAQQQVG